MKDQVLLGFQKLVSIISVNTAKWYEAANDKFKYYLALMHYGIDEEILSENGVDVGDANFQEIRNMLMHACAEHALDKAKDEGDEKMKKMMSVYLTERGIEEGIKIGRAEGKIKVYHEELQLTPEEIATKMKIPVERVIETLQLHG